MCQLQPNPFLKGYTIRWPRRMTRGNCFRRKRKKSVRVFVLVAGVAVEIPSPLFLWMFGALPPAAANAPIGLAMPITYLGSLEANKGMKRGIVESMPNALLTLN